MGTLRADEDAQLATAAADGSYRAFAFEPMGAVIAHVVAPSDADPVAYILDANRRIVKRNDNRNASTKDAEIRFTATTQGTHYLAFRTKDGRAAPIMARLYNPSSDAARAAPRPTGTFVDTWPLPASSMVSTAPRVFDVDVYGAGTVNTNPQGCPSRGVYVPGRTEIGTGSEAVAAGRPDRPSGGHDRRAQRHLQ